MTSKTEIRELNWFTYWSKESPEMKFKIPSDLLKGKQILSIDIKIDIKDGGRLNTSYSIPYHRLEDLGVRGLVKYIIKSLEDSYFMGQRTFTPVQFSDLISQVTDCKILIDDEFNLRNFFKYYWWDPFMDRAESFWIRIFNR